MGKFDFWWFIFYELARIQEVSKAWRRAEAKVRRMVKPTVRSKSVNAIPEIVKRWDAGGDLKNDLIRTMMKCDGNKDCYGRCGLLNLYNAACS